MFVLKKFKAHFKICYRRNMTTIEHGGGPTLNQRKDFCELNDGAMIPGYQGYCPSLKFTFGKTFSKSTRELNNKKPDYNNNYINNNNIQIYSTTTKQQLRSTIVPENNGRNKYTKDMVSGYTGFIPKCSTKFGKTYRDECDNCFREHFHDLEKYHDKAHRDKLTFKQASPFLENSHTRKNDLLRTLNEFSDRLSLSEGRKPKTEAPIAGYTGFIPKKNTTELGLGASYNIASEKSLEKFDLETDAYKNKMAFLESNVTCCCRYM